MKLPFWPEPSGYRDIELGLTRVYDLLARLDNPHKKLPPTIHIAGTNGKGSTLSFLKSIFNENGYKTHNYTSPHLVNFNERIILADQEISDDFLNECLNECKKAAEISPKIAVTYFEGITVAAFLAFSKVKADILLLEVGMGGRLDATNVIEKNLLSIITPIAFDHTDFLGKTLSKIAFEKAGIIKKNCPTVISKQNKSSLTAIKKQAKKMQSEVAVFGEDFNFKIKKNNFDFKSKTFGNIDNIDYPALLGKHQIENACVAIAASLLQTKFKLNKEKFNSAIKNTFWPGRLQKVTNGVFFNKLMKKAASDFELIVDGSHNAQGANTLKTFLKTKKAKKRILFFAMLNDKDCEAFLDKIKSEIDLLIALEIRDEVKSLKSSEVLEITKKLNIKSLSAKNFNDAFEQVLKMNIKQESLITICGSLYQAGNFLEENHEK